MTQLDRTANLVGALCLVVADRTTDAVGAAAGQAESAAAALSALHNFLGRPSIDVLRRVLGLTHSGTVRLVDRLVAAGYVTREPGPDARATAIALTDAGRAAAVRVVDTRAAVLQDALSTLSESERDTLAALAAKMITGIVATKDDPTRWICRLCDTAVCGADEGRCPARNAGVAKYRSAGG